MSFGSHAEEKGVLFAVGWKKLKEMKSAMDFWHSFMFDGKKWSIIE